jgi:hypothetical protein
VKEQVLRFGQWRSLVGVLTEPRAGTANADAPVVLFLNAGLLHHIGPHRLHVQLARRLARAGVQSLRFDLSGIGDSGPREDRMGRGESMVRETQDAMDTLAAAHGARRFVLFGICTGADQAVRVALADERVAGAVLVDGYAYQTTGHVLRYYFGRGLRPRSWWNVLSLRHPAFRRYASRLRGKPARSHAGDASGGPRPGIYLRPPRAEAEARIGALAARGCRLCVVFTPTTTVSHAAQFGEMFPSLRRHTAIRIVFLKHANHVFTLLASQAAVMDAVEAWIGEAFVGRRRTDDAALGSASTGGSAGPS